MYDHKQIEQKWREKWQKTDIFETDIEGAKKPFYNLMMFPYPSGEGLHVGHVFTFGGIDTFGRLKRMQGFDVFEPMGFDAFGIHSENYAIKVQKHPKELTAQTVEYFREEQLKKLGALFDWRFEVNTTDPGYYKWTQWLFLKLFKAGLAERKKSPVNFCPSCKTVLADEQVISGRCERCDSVVQIKELEQWFFKITKYADRLLKNLDRIDWPSSTKTLQRNWIGRSEGTIIKFPVVDSQLEIEVFTTRPDTIFGATFIILAPDHKLVRGLASNEQLREVSAYQSKYMTDKNEAKRAKTGVFLGSYVLNPFTKKKIPIWIADYVSSDYGTGAIMAVPAHDERDYEFAKKFKLPIIEVIQGGDISKEAYVGEGNLKNSGEFSELVSQEAIKKISKYIEEHDLGKRKVSYHLRDWLISRQRYWGPPIPIIYCGKCGVVPVPEEDLPVLLPELQDFQPKGKGISPLATLSQWVNVKCPQCQGEARRETDVSDTFLDSSWYFLRYPTVQARTSGQVPFDAKITKKWLPVDSYIGGQEHASLHLLYTRFITMALYDVGLLDFEEPFKKFRTNGLIIHKGAKMSKSRGNVVNPNDYIDKYGVDALRMYLLFIGPFDQGGDFSDLGISGIQRFINRVYSLVLSREISQEKPKLSDLRLLHKTIWRVTEDIEELRFNTATASIMEYFNYLNKKEKVGKQELEVLSLLLAPLTPHFSEELWEMIGNKYSIHNQKWPDFDPKYLEEDKFCVIVQINGKLRDKLEADSDSTDEKLKDLAVSSAKIKKYLQDKSIKHIIVVPKKDERIWTRLVNIVV